MKNIEGRISNLEQQMLPRPKTHCLLMFNDEPEQTALDRHGPHRIGEGEKTLFIRIVGVRPEAQILPFARPARA